MKKLLSLVVLVVVLMSLVGCMKPYKKEMWVEVNSNETAYVIPVEASTDDGQIKFDSEEFLEQNKVAAKRIILNQRFVSTGRGYWQGKWVPLELVIKVDRSPISLQWTSDSNSGTSSRKESFAVESNNSIAFEIGSTITCRIVNPSLYLYSFPGNQSLTNVANNLIYRRAMGIITEEFGKYSLNDCREKKAEIFAIARGKLQNEFIKYGIEVTQFDLSGQLNYINQEIQKNIDEEFISQNRLKIEYNNRLAQAETRKNTIEEAETKLKASQIFAKALEIEKEKNKLDVNKILAESRLEWAKNWNGALPLKVLPENSSLLMNLGD